MSNLGKRIVAGIVIGIAMLTIRVIANYLGVWDW